MEENKIGFGDILVSVSILMMLLKWSGVLAVAWSAINRFTIFVLIYLLVGFVIDTTIKVIDMAVSKRDE